MRTRPRKARKWLRPRAVEREYERELLRYVEEVFSAVRRDVLPALDLLRLDAVEDLPESAGWFETLRRSFLAAARAIAGIPMSERVAEFGRQAARFNKRQFHAVVRSAYGVDVFVNEPWLDGVLRQWESTNIGLIKSIPSQALDKLHGKIVAAVRRGGTVRDLTDAIRDEYGVTRSRAKLIANDQIGKLNGQLTQERQTRLGVKSYKWRGSLDERERDEHVAREGVVFTWDKPPPDGHPGEPIRCRCSAEPILPLLEDLPGGLLDLTPSRGSTLTQLANRSALL